MGKVVLLSKECSAANVAKAFYIACIDEARQELPEHPIVPDVITLAHHKLETEIVAKHAESILDKNPKLADIARELDQIRQARMHDVKGLVA